MTKDEKISELVQHAVEAFKLHAAPSMLSEPAAIKTYYAVFNGPAVWKPGIRTPQETPVANVKKTARFKRSFGS